MSLLFVTLTRSIRKGDGTPCLLGQKKRASNWAVVLDVPPGQTLVDIDRPLAESHDSDFLDRSWTDKFSLSVLEDACKESVQEVSVCMICGA